MQIALGFGEDFSLVMLYHDGTIGGHYIIGPQGFQHLFCQSGAIRRIREDNIELFAPGGEALDGGKGVGLHDLISGLPVLAQQGDAQKIQVLPDEPAGALVFLHKGHFLRPSRKRLQAHGPAAGKKVQKSQPGQILAQKIEQGLAREILRGPDACGHIKIPALELTSYYLHSYKVKKCGSTRFVVGQ